MTQSPEYIEDDIERTRARIDAKLNRLGDEMSPTQMLKSIVGANGNSPTELLGAVAIKARENPIPALLVGAGIAGFMLTGGDRRRDDRQSDENGHEAAQDSRLASDDPAERIAHGVGSLKSKAEDLRDSVTETARDVRSQVVAGAHSVKGRVEHAGESLKNSAQDNIHAVAETVSDVRARAERVVHDSQSGAKSAGHYVGDQMRRSRERTDAATSWVKDNPVPAGLMALALGAAAASFMTARKATDNSHSPQNRRTEHEPAESAVGVDEPAPFPDLPRAAAPAVEAKTARPRKRTAGKARAPKAKPVSAKPKEPKQGSKTAGSDNKTGRAASTA